MKIIHTLLYIFLRLFYKKIKGANPLHILATTFFTQKILGFNRFVSWPVHHSSRVLYPRKIKVGINSFPGWSNGNYIQARNGIEIGNNVRLGPNVGLISADHKPDNFDQWIPSKPIKIGDNVWVGMNSVILSGVTIGDNVVIGANSVVTKDIPSDSVAVGSPCKVIKNKEPYTGIDYGKI